MNRILNAIKDNSAALSIAYIISPPAVIAAIAAIPDTFYSTEHTILLFIFTFIYNLVGLLSIFALIFTNTYESRNKRFITGMIVVLTLAFLITYITILPHFNTQESNAKQPQDIKPSPTPLLTINPSPVLTNPILSNINPNIILIYIDRNPYYNKTIIPPNTYCVYKTIPYKGFSKIDVLIETGFNNSSISVNKMILDSYEYNKLLEGFNDNELNPIYFNWNKNIIINYSSNEDRYILIKNNDPKNDVIIDFSSRIE